MRGGVRVRDDQAWLLESEGVTACPGQRFRGQDRGGGTGRAVQSGRRRRWYRRLQPGGLGDRVNGTPLTGPAGTPPAPALTPDRPPGRRAAPQLPFQCPYFRLLPSTTPRSSPCLPSLSPVLLHFLRLCCHCSPLHLPPTGRPPAPLPPANEAFKANYPGFSIRHRTQALKGVGPGDSGLFLGAAVWRLWHPLSQQHSETGTQLPYPNAGGVVRRALGGLTEGLAA